jgi:hypothetical protein
MTWRCVLAVAVAMAALPAVAAASDTTIATTARATPLAADAGRLLYSAWDGSAYRLTLLAGGTSQTLPVAGQAQPFRADIGPGPDGHELAVYPRCESASTGCDLYAFDFTTGIERRLANADSPSDDEIAGAVWRGTLVFSRVYRSRHRGFIYQRPLAGGGRSRRVSALTALTLDLRGTRVPFSRSLEWSNEPWLAGTAGAPSRRLATVPGSGAAVDFLTDVNPTAYGSSIYWLLASSGDDDYSEIHRFNRTRGRDERVPTRIPAVAGGFAYDAGVAYYAAPVQGTVCPPDRDCMTTIHRVDGLAFEPAPPIRLR